MEQIRLGNDGKRMILIPAGWFLMGTSEPDSLQMQNQLDWRPSWFTDEMPQHRVYLDAVYVDETPVTCADYKKFLADEWRYQVPVDWDAASRSYPYDRAEHPVVNVSWEDANAYARWAGKRLPSEAEWEKAARGMDARRFPWGDKFYPSHCNTVPSNVGATMPVTRHAPQGNSPFGVIDLAGNVWEWCADWYAVAYYAESASGKNPPTQNPKGPESGEWRVLRGGAFDSSADYARCASRDFIVPETGYATVGFRCVMEV
jgi:formylglycine-generating enzyme required for sulfatase activity